MVYYFIVTVNNIEDTVNTSICRDMLTIITTKDRSGGIYNNYSTGGQGIMAVVIKACPRAMSSDSINLWQLCYNHNIISPTAEKFIT